MTKRDEVIITRIIEDLRREFKHNHCNNCKNLLLKKNIIICDIHNYYLTEESIEVLKCDEWESK